MKAFSLMDQEHAAQLFQVRPRVVIPPCVYASWPASSVCKLKGLSWQESTELFKQALALDPGNDKCARARAAAAALDSS